MKSIFAVIVVTTSVVVAQSATIKVDASRVENRINPRIYASFVEMMAEDVKWGLAAEMIHDRSFEESPDYLGLPAGWRLEPDERNDNVGAIKFTQTTDESYPRVNRATGGPMSSIAPSSSSNSATATSAPGANSGKADSCLFSSAQSRNEVREVRFPSDAGIIGRVVAVSMSIADMKQYASE